MKRFKLSSFNVSLQIQLFLTTLFQLQKISSKHTSSQELISKMQKASFWQEDSGFLHQLKSQAQHLLQAYPDPILNELNEGLEKAIALCENGKDGEDLVKKTFQLTADFLHTVPPDENLYYFLLRHQEECKKAFGRVFLLSLFKKKHKGLKQTEEFLISKYHERGFSHLKNSIKQHLLGLTRC